MRMPCNTQPNCAPRRPAIALLAAAAVLAPALAAPPLEPLPVPFYSFDLASPAVQQDFVQARDVLGLAQPRPVPAILGDDLGLFLPQDDLDALSGPTDYIDATVPFVVLFSVDRVTQGLAPLDPVLFDLEVPYNVTDQAFRGHAAGDQFVALQILNDMTPITVGRNPANNTSVRNNFDEGGTDFAAEPPTRSRDTSTDTQDNNNATGRLASTTRTVGDGGVYFTLTAESPSLDVLPGAQFPSGASIYYNPGPFRETTSLFAPYFALGLQPADDIDAMVVFDRGTLGTWDSGDRILFSLARQSPSLDIIPGASSVGAAADIFGVQFGQNPVVVLKARDFGLGAPPDSVNALDVLPIFTPDILDFARLHGIRAVIGDANDDALVNAEDFRLWELLLTGPDNGPIPPEFFVLDPDFDRDLDLRDLARLQTRFAGSQP